jgi:thiamine biosynthesis lipoprotein
MGKMNAFSRDAMACTYEVLIEGPEDVAAYAMDKAWEELDRLEQELSRFVPTSDVTRINMGAGTRAVRIGQAAWDVLLIAGEVWKSTGGAFDVTWGSTGKLEPGKPPVILDPEHMTAYVEAGRRVDLGAIGKGYALDAIAKILREWDVEKAVLSSGQSTMLVLGETVAELRDPNQGHKPVGKLRVRDYAVSGSGMVLHGAHILDPKTGRPATGKMATWAAAPSGAVSDALSTAFMVMPPEKVAAFCEEFEDVAGLIMTSEGKAMRFGGVEEVAFEIFDSEKK